MNHHIQRLIIKIFNRSDYDIFSVKSDYLLGDFVAQAEFMGLRTSFWERAENPDKATLNLLKRIRLFCKEEGLKMVIGEDRIRFLNQDRKEFTGFIPD